ncbi:YitT family protein [Bacillus cytotoxicus]|uniref:YitT family protein n=1 Tax=Bacillus cytotoxicus TaxID=580165 RepID=UPI001AEE782F|nr:YitT family protein [Bacillus cytotoxicus]QTR86978.1 YitT family protein [Bacillus cytotoxicus]
MAINKKYPEFSIARGIRYINFIVLALGLVIYGIKSAVVGICFSLVNSYILDLFLRKNIKQKI